MNLHVKDRKLIISVYLTLFFNQESNLKVKRKKKGLNICHKHFVTKTIGTF